MPRTKMTCCLLALATGSMMGASAHSAAPVEVYGYFCSAKTEQVNFLERRAAGESEEVAANSVNKSSGKLACAYYMPAKAIPSHTDTVMNEGIVYSVQSYLFLPEKIERWTGNFFGSSQPRKPAGQL
jgi:hypothetical protein